MRRLAQAAAVAALLCVGVPTQGFQYGEIPPTEPPTPGCGPQEIEPLSGGGSECDDGNPCTDDECIGGVCRNDPMTGDPCPDDGNPCTDDYCVAGACEHEPLSGASCDDGDSNPCTQDTCDGYGVCSQHEPISGPVLPPRQSAMRVA